MSGNIIEEIIEEAEVDEPMTGKEIRRARNLLCLSQHGLARRMRLSGTSGHVTVCQWEKDRRSMTPSHTEFLRTLVKYEGIDISKLEDKEND